MTKEVGKQSKSTRQSKYKGIIQKYMNPRPHRTRKQRKDIATIGRPIEVNLFHESHKISERSGSRSVNRSRMNADLAHDKETSESNPEITITTTVPVDIDRYFKETPQQVCEENYDPNESSKKGQDQNKRLQDRNGIRVEENTTSKKASRNGVSKVLHKRNSKSAYNTLSPITLKNKNSRILKKPSVHDIRNSKTSIFIGLVDQSVELLESAVEKVQLESIRKLLRTHSDLNSAFKQNNTCIKNGNMMIFTFLNFYKDFEQKIINGK